MENSKNTEYWSGDQQQEANQPPRSPLLETRRSGEENFKKTKLLNLKQEIERLKQKLYDGVTGYEVENFTKMKITANELHSAFQIVLDSKRSASEMRSPLASIDANELQLEVNELFKKIKSKLDKLEADYLDMPRELDQTKEVLNSFMNNSMTMIDTSSKLRAQSIKPLFHHLPNNFPPQANSITAYKETLLLPPHSTHNPPNHTVPAAATSNMNVRESSLPRGEQGPYWSTAPEQPGPNLNWTPPPVSTQLESKENWTPPAVSMQLKSKENWAPHPVPKQLESKENWTPPHHKVQFDLAGVENLQHVSPSKQSAPKQNWMLRPFVDQPTSNLNWTTPPVVAQPVPNQNWAPPAVSEHPVPNQNWMPPHHSVQFELPGVEHPQHLPPVPKQPTRHNLPAQASSPVDPMQYHCTKCPDTFTTIGQLWFHVKITHEDEPTPFTTTVPKEETDMKESSSGSKRRRLDEIETIDETHWRNIMTPPPLGSPDFK